LESDEVKESYKEQARTENEAFQADHPEITATVKKTGGTRRSPPKNESLENYKNVDYLKHVNDDDHDEASCGAWLNKSDKYCTRRKKAGSDEPFCKGHMKSYEEAFAKYSHEVVEAVVESDTE
jgi:hypothetical protein